MSLLDGITRALKNSSEQWLKSTREAKKRGGIIGTTMSLPVVEEPIAEGALTEEGSRQTVRNQHRRKKNNKITGTLLPGNGSLFGV